MEARALKGHEADKEVLHAHIGGNISGRRSAKANSVRHAGKWRIHS